MRGWKYTVFNGNASLGQGCQASKPSIYITVLKRKEGIQGELTLIRKGKKMTLCKVNLKSGGVILPTVNSNGYVVFCINTLDTIVRVIN